MRATHDEESHATEIELSFFFTSPATRSFFYIKKIKDMHAPGVDSAFSSLFLLYVEIESQVGVSVFVPNLISSTSSSYHFGCYTVQF
uniref:Uncharacterized protein n=1 Tax=Arundo donax TaxID=35708 RepID=A0A0A8ZMU2_ARUDO